eukprot:COSAG01_NODE_2187_length_8196_cov_76.436458_3_plen_76_part_00
MCVRVPSGSTAKAHCFDGTQSASQVLPSATGCPSYGVLRPELLEQLLAPKKSETEILVVRPALASSTAPTARAYA